MTRAFISGLAGPTLSADERAFLREAGPWGAILFKRNIETPDQVRRLLDDVRGIVGRDLPVLVDQEGGRVQRLGPPHWPNYPTGAAYGRVYDRDKAEGLSAARLGARLIAADLAALGINVDCLPLADVPVDGADPIIGDRAYGTTPDQVAIIAREVAAGLMDGGVLPVLKHIPGHGRASVDSHEKLPVVDTPRDVLAATDFRPFAQLKHLPLAMTAHVVYSAIDPLQPATTSAVMIGDVIRDSIGFAGALMSDDVSMGALSGTIAERTRAALAAGCDLVLHCNGNLDEMRAVASETPVLSGLAGKRAAAALAARRPASDIDLSAERKRFAGLMDSVAVATRVAGS
jgi:beta-N-acetylhexosaminidase